MPPIGCHEIQLFLQKSWFIKKTTHLLHKSSNNLFQIKYNSACRAKLPTRDPQSAHPGPGGHGFWGQGGRIWGPDPIWGPWTLPDPLPTPIWVPTYPLASLLLWMNQLGSFEGKKEAFSSRGGCIKSLDRPDPRVWPGLPPPSPGRGPWITKSDQILKKLPQLTTFGLFLASRCHLCQNTVPSWILFPNFPQKYYFLITKKLFYTLFQEILLIFSESY